MIQFYSYLWLREDGTPYYAGKGNGNRAFRRKNHVACPPTKQESILIFPMISEAEAFESERALIELFGRKDFGTGALLNRTAGGQGSSGRRASVETRVKIAAASARAQKGRKHSPEHVARVADANRGKRRSSEQRARISCGKTGTTLTPEHKEKLRLASTGQVHSEVARLHMSAAQKGHPATFAGRKHTAESIKKQSAARKAYWERKRQCF